jgi:hypothetical protein
MTRHLDSRNALFFGFLLAGACWVSIGDATLEAQSTKASGSYADGGEMVLRGSPFMTSSEELRVGDGCVDIRGSLVSGRFFFNLKRKMTAGGPVFHLGRRTVTDFPDDVMLFVEVTSGFPCSKGKPAGAAIPSLEPLKSPRAEAVYIRGLKRYPLEINLGEEDNNLPPSAPPALRDRVWHYQFQVKTRGVLLTDALVITLFTREGQKFAQLTWRQ